MIAAVHAMAYGWQAFCFAVAVLLFVLAAFGSSLAPRVNFVALGLAVFVFVFAWNALAAT